MPSSIRRLDRITASGPCSLRTRFMAERMSAATNRLIFMLWSRDEVGGVAVGERGWSVVCTVRVPLGICLLRVFESGVCFLARCRAASADRSDQLQALVLRHLAVG